MSIRIGLIDSGINANHSLITKNNIIVDGWKGTYSDFNDFLGHGTQCAGLILKSSENISQIFNVKVFDKHLRTTTRNILDALQWCISNHIQLINLSLSVSDINYYYEFKQICDEAAKKNIIIVASADNIGRSCLPAYLSNVLGVGVAKINNDHDFYYTDSSIQLYSNGMNPNSTINQQNAHATSFATARITGRVATILQKYPQIDFNQLKNVLQLESLPLKKEKILIKNKKVDLNKWTIPISLNKLNNTKLISKELQSISDRHITNNQKLNIALINLTNEVDIINIELKLKNEFIKKNKKVVHISSSTKAETFGFNYFFPSYREIPEKLHSAYAKALVETINNNHPDTELVIIGMNKSVVPSNINGLSFFDNYSIPELSLFFGFQLDTCIFVVNELTEFGYIQRNIDCMKSLFDAETMFIIYSSLCHSTEEKDMTQLIPNFEQVKKISTDRFKKLQTEIHDKLNIGIYDINDKKYHKNIFDKISDTFN